MLFPGENTVSREYILHRFGGTICFVISATHTWHSCERTGSLTSVIRLLKTQYLTTWTSVYTVVKPRTCRRAIIVTIRDRIVTGLKLLRNHRMQLRGFALHDYSRLCLPSLPLFSRHSRISVEHSSFRTF